MVFTRKGARNLKYPRNNACRRQIHPCSTSHSPNRNDPVSRTHTTKPHHLTKSPGPNLPLVALTRTSLDTFPSSRLELIQHARPNNTHIRIDRNHIETLLRPITRIRTIGTLGVQKEEEEEKISQEPPSNLHTHTEREKSPPHHVQKIAAFLPAL